MKIPRKIYVITFIIATLMILACSCGQKGYSLKENLSPTDKSIIELSARKYTTQELSDIIQFGGSVSELNKKYPVECLRSDGEIYRVSYLGFSEVAVIVFDEAENKILSNIYVTENKKSDFAELKEGQQLDAVKAIAPNGDYTFLYSGRNDVEHSSVHYTDDGYIVTVGYDNSNKIISVKYDLI